jgi:predicted transcriptional regulator
VVVVDLEVLEVEKALTQVARQRPDRVLSLVVQVHPKCMWSKIAIALHILPHIMKTIQITIDNQLLELVDKLSRARKMTRSAFIREALEAEIRRERIREEENRHAEGYSRAPVAQGEFDVWLNEQDWGAS